MRARRFNLLSPAVVVLATVALVAAVLDAEGYRTPDLRLHDAGVWISWAKEGAIGRTNTQVNQVDIRLNLESGDFDLLQSDAVVLVHDRNAIIPIDGRSALPLDPVALPSGSFVALGGPEGAAPTAAVLDPSDGRLWVAEAEVLLRTDFGVSSDGDVGRAADTPPTKPTATLEGATDLVVGPEGVAWALAPRDGRLVGIDRAGAQVDSPAVADIDVGRDVQLTTAGAIPVVLDPAGGLLLLPGEAPIDISGLGDDPQLQQPGPASDVVYLATDSTLAAVEIATGEVSSLTDEGTGIPARPLLIRGCVWSAWGGSPRYANVCGDADPRVAEIPGLVGGTELRFRTNRGKVVINELETGKSAVLIEDEDAREVDWSQAILESEQDDNSDAPPSKADELERDPDQKPPVAVDDIGRDGFGTRPDRSVVIDPLRNDTDPNDDVLVIDGVAEVSPTSAAVDIVGGGRAVQVTPAPGSMEPVTFSYTINDGFDPAPEPAQVEVAISSLDDNEGPRFRRKPSTFVVVGKTVTHNVIADAFDPDGDPLALLVPVDLDPSKGTLTADVGGTIVYTAPGEGFPAGVVTIPITISDGMDHANSELEDELVVNVLGKPGNAPVALGDHAETTVGREVVVDVLANDSDADGDALRVVGVGSFTGAQTSIDEQNRVHVTHSRPGTVSVEYSITDGGTPVTGKLRVDVRESTQGAPPIAVRDDVVLRPTAPAIADVLANDIDPDGDVLVVQTVEVPAISNLAVEIVEHRFLRISATDGKPLASVVSFAYVVTDGGFQDRGTVVVRPGPATSADQAPRALADQFTIRVGNVAALDVLGNDVDPEGGELTIGLNLLPDQIDMFFVQAGLLRFVAPRTPQSLHIVYRAIDPTGRESSATVDLHVVPENHANNGPRPPDLTARTVAGREVEIPVPVSSIDPEGDDVTLLGVSDNPPQHGSIIEVGVDRLKYLPDLYAGGFYGTDTFTYRVRDSLGAEATATIRVGVAPPPTINSAPVAIDDLRQVVEGGTITIQVDRNDSDPEGDDLSVVADSLGLPPGVPWTAELDEGGAVDFSASGLDVGAEAAFTYEVTDGILSDQGVVRVAVVPEASNLPPVALDDRHAPALEGEIVDIEVLDNDSDPDGSPDDLVVSVPDVSGAEVVGNVVRLTMPAADVAVVYTLTDGVGASSKAVARVRLADQRRLRPIAVYDDVATDQDAAVTVDVLDNDDVSTDTKVLLGVDGARNGTCATTGDDRVTFTPNAGFWGTGGCNYTLGDGPGDAAETLRSIGMIGVEVRRIGNTPPTFIEQPLVIHAGQKVEVPDLRAAVRDPDDGDLARIEFSDLRGETSGVTASFDGPRFEVSVDERALGGEVVLTFTVTDGTDTTMGLVRVLVIPRPAGDIPVADEEPPGSLAILVPDSAETIQGKPVQIPVLANDQPAENGEPLTIIRLSPSAGGTSSHDGRTVTFSPGAQFHGTTTFSYTVGDGTLEVGREVTSTVTVTVFGIPDAPPAPSVVRESRAITLSWGVPADNGAPITEYWVRANGGPGSRTETGIRGNTFRFDGLENGATYTFQIAALNRAVTGEPQFSPPSPGITPNAIPNAPAAPVAKFDPAGEIIDVSWSDPGGEGTAVTGYDLEVSPLPASGQPPRQSGSTTSYRVTGLQNGTPYTFRVRAINDLQGEVKGESPWSAYSAPETPAAPPDAPLRPVIVNEGDTDITVSWQAPFENGDPISSYKVEVSRNGAVAGTTVISDPGVTQATITTDNGEEFTFRVQAENKAGLSDFSPASEVATSFGVPGPVIAVQATDGDRSSVLTFEEPDENGAPITSYRYAINSGAWVDAGASSPITVSGLSNGVTYSFQVQAQNERGWADQPGATSNQVKPYGQPTQPASAGGSNSGGNINWSWSASDGNGRNITGYRVTIDGSTVTVGGTSHTTGGYSDDGSTHNITVVALSDGADPARNQSLSTSGSVKRPNPPPPVVTVSQGASAAGKACQNGPCGPGVYHLYVSWNNLPAGGHSYSCQQANGGEFWSGGGLSGSSGSQQLPCYADASVYGGVRVVLDGTYVSNTANW